MKYKSISLLFVKAWRSHTAAVAFPRAARAALPHTRILLLCTTLTTLTTLATRYNRYRYTHYAHYTHTTHTLYSLLSHALSIPGSVFIAPIRLERLAHGVRHQRRAKI